MSFLAQPSSLVMRMLELAVLECDMEFIKYLITEQSVDVNGEPLH